MKIAISFTNFGPYHLARLRALSRRLAQLGSHLIGYETAGQERRYPWRIGEIEEPFEWVTFFPDQVLEDIPYVECARAMRKNLSRDQPDVVGIAGYVRPECLAALNWANRYRRPAILLSESQAIDRPRVWWKEAIKRRRVRRFDAALVGGPSHRDYLRVLGIPTEQIALGYNAVDNEDLARRADKARDSKDGTFDLPKRRYFLSVVRFVAEKNLERLIWSFARYRRDADPNTAWDLVLCGSGERNRQVEAAIRASGCSGSVHRPGFLQLDDLARWYAFASAFVLPSVSEPWGLVANEAAACGLPLLVSERAGCAQTLVPDPPGTTGRRFNPLDDEMLSADLAWMASLSERERSAMGRRAASVVAEWGPDRFARGFLEALKQSRHPQGQRNAHVHQS